MKKTEAELRATGRTTRLCDHLIQQLFTVGYVLIEDHYPDDKAHRRLFQRVLKRLETEHGMLGMRDLVLDMKKLVIKLKE